MVGFTSDYRALEMLLAQDVLFQSVRHCVRLGLFDALAGGAMTATEVAERFGFKERPAQALLDLLEAGGILRVTERGYENSRAASSYLSIASPLYQGKAMELNIRFNQSVFNRFEDLLRGDLNQRQESDNNWSAEETMEGTLQHARLGGLKDMVQFTAGLPGFNDMRFMCDMGGSHGEYSMEILDLNPNLRGVILDLPRVAAKANERIKQRGFLGRLKAKPHDLLTQPLPEKAYDLVLASHILYAFVDDLESVAAMIYASLKPGGWFVSQHMAPNMGMPHQYACSLEFVTLMAGYPTHFIGRKELSDAMWAAGFETVVTAASDMNRGNLILAGRRANAR